MSDDELEADVLAELQAEPAAHQSRIDVRARRGKVTVSGQVSSFSEKQKIDGAVARVAGAKGVLTEISFKRTAGMRATREPDAHWSNGITSPYRAYEW